MKDSIGCVSFDDHLFPARLGEVRPMVKKLWYGGEWSEKIFEKTVAVVGSRRMSRYGKQVIEKYRRRISGPILDRIDLHVWVDPVEVFKLTSGKEEGVRESSRQVRERVERARRLQAERFTGENGIYTNA
jgi:hypothetical protein